MDTLVESNTAALIGSKCVDVKGEISHATLNMMIKIKRLQLSHIGCIINMILQNKVHSQISIKDGYYGRMPAYKE